MRLSAAIQRSLRSGSRALVIGVGVLLAAGGPTSALCVGDCDGTGAITIDELVLGVTIALGSRPPSDCPAFLDAEGQIDISQLIKGVSNSLGGCPPEATATSTSSAATPTDTAVPSVSATSTPLPTASVVATSTVTAVPPTPTSAAATATASSPPATAVITATATATADATDTAAPPASPTATDAATATVTPIETATGAATPSTTATPFLVGASVAGRVALVSRGLEGLDALVSAIILAQTNDGSAEALVRNASNAETVVVPRGPAICAPCIEHEAECFCCPVDGFSDRTCAAVGQGLEVTFVLDACAALGAQGGTATFDGSITIAAGEGVCPFAFSSGALTVDSLTAVYRDAQMAQSSSVSADLTGTIAPMASGTACQISGLTLTLTGTLTSLLPDGSGVTASFSGTDVAVDQIVFGPDCLPLAYKLTVSGQVTFAPLPVASGFVVQFTNFLLDQVPMSGFRKTALTGNLGSMCFGGGVSVTTINPLTLAVGEPCPHSGQLLVSGIGGATATVSYEEGQVAVIQGGSQTTYPSCVDADLMMCP